ncbi:hypothetical protein ACN26Y_20470 [Micromonospora sp. WMMD558]|uniref:hypothetical protein n=1 Tax=unclassified Micromonospora TaxID=2617518 RepID=UPI0012B4C52C|nr:hypothetical protein [Micromonospora sp. WMMC415]QGN48450.1 hypothetical protein GKC29_17455 [Micromonospora sp. WMMC415]
MRVARVLVPLAVTGMVLAGCGEPTTGGATWSAPADAASAAGNGVADLTAAEILRKTNAALKKAGSFRVEGQRKDGGSTLSIDLKVMGEDLAGTLGLNGQRIQLLLVGGQPYFKANETFWKESGPRGEGMAQLIGDRWVTVARDDKNFGSLFTIAEDAANLAPDGTATKGEAKTIDAGPAITLIDESDRSTLYVATTGEPYPLLIVGPDNQGQLAYSEFGKSFPDIKKPAAADVIDFSKL